MCCRCVVCMHACAVGQSVKRWPPSVLFTVCLRSGGSAVSSCVCVCEGAAVCRELSQLLWQRPFWGGFKRYFKHEIVGAQTGFVLWASLHRSLIIHLVTLSPKTNCTGVSPLDTAWVCCQQSDECVCGLNSSSFLSFHLKLLLSYCDCWLNMCWASL